MNVHTTNPLLARAESGGLPEFDRIQPGDAVSAVEAVLAENRTRLETILAPFAGAEAIVTWDQVTKMEFLEPAVSA